MSHRSTRMSRTLHDARWPSLAICASQHHRHRLGLGLGLGFRFRRGPGFLSRNHQTATRRFSFTSAAAKFAHKNLDRQVHSPGKINLEAFVFQIPLDRHHELVDSLLGPMQLIAQGQVAEGSNGFENISQTYPTHVPESRLRTPRARGHVDFVLGDVGEAEGL